ncbi:MAG: 30S ribosomal protein S7 [Candidatus Pacebacteria bacterium]|nr:30S ribosomal protein S7 [Candidatus Paceibacterota bacterium]
MAKKFKTINLEPDPIYDNITVAKLINQIMKEGKKNTARKIVYGALDIIKEKGNEEPITVLEKAVFETAPEVEVRAKRVGGATYQVPMEVPQKRALSLSMRWIITAARAKKGKPMHAKLADELMAASKGEGEAIKKKINVHKMAEANRAFAHMAR